MSEMALAIIFGPTLLGGSASNVADSQAHLIVAETIITYAHDMFEDD